MKSMENYLDSLATGAPVSGLSFFIGVVSAKAIDDAMEKYEPIYKTLTFIGIAVAVMIGCVVITHLLIKVLKWWRGNEQKMVSDVHGRSEVNAIAEASSGTVDVTFWKSTALVFAFDQFPIYKEVIEWFDNLNGAVSREVFEIHWATDIPDRATRLEIMEAVQVMGLVNENRGQMVITPEGKAIAQRIRNKQEQEKGLEESN